MKALVFTLRQRPDQRLDLSPLVPHLLAGKSATDIERIALQTTRQGVTVGDVFRVRMGDGQNLHIDGACERLDRIGHGMTAGEILVDGDVGSQAGRLMSGGRLIVNGSTGPWAASGMTGGTMEIAAATGDRLGGPLAGEMAGMRGGVVIVRGNVGDRAGDRMRRGTIIVEGNAGSYPGSRMIAGTLIVRGATGPLPGYLMRRGTIVLCERTNALPPTFVDCGVHALVATRLLADFVTAYSRGVAARLSSPLRRLAGDMAVLGKGEIFCPPG